MPVHMQSPPEKRIIEDPERCPWLDPRNSCRTPPNPGTRLLFVPSLRCKVVPDSEVCVRLEAEQLHGSRITFRP